MKLDWVWIPMSIEYTIFFNSIHIKKKSRTEYNLLLYWISVSIINLLLWIIIISRLLYQIIYFLKFHAALKSATALNWYVFRHNPILSLKSRGIQAARNSNRPQHPISWLRFVGECSTDACYRFIQIDVRIHIR